MRLCSMSSIVAGVRSTSCPLIKDFAAGRIKIIITTMRMHVIDRVIG
jgi:hypothetical protein